MFLLKSYVQNITEDVKLLVTLNLRQEFGVEIIIVDTDPESQTNHVLNIAETLVRYSGHMNTASSIFAGDRRDIILTLLPNGELFTRGYTFIEVEKTPMLASILEQNGLPEDTPLFQYHPPRPVIYDTESMIAYPGYFPLQSKNENDFKWVDKIARVRH